MPKRPELLAPVGSWESLLAAVNSGADAVYLGGTMFSARANANNFDDEEMLRAVEFCHLRGVKVYVTVNTLIADEELEKALDYLKFLYSKGIDAVIVQDLGLARLARKLLPNLELHASTQMTVHNLSGVELLKEEGFKRIVLAREMSLDNIKEIKEKSSSEIEVFIHGALCVCYSGQCLMSSLIGGRSGNRGRCAQPCRLAYTLVDKQGKALVEPEQLGKHLLSPKDLNMIHHIPELIESGIDSFKIEGRMKRPEYVATVIRVYRNAIDRYLADPDNYAVTEEEDKALWQIFNRDFTTGYFYNRQGRDLMSYKRPNNRGIRLGRVTAFNSFEKKIEIALDEPLNVGDGLEAWVTEGGRQGAVIRRIIKDGQSVDEAFPGDKVWIELPGKIRTGDRVFKTHDARLMEEAAFAYTSAKAGQRVPLKCIAAGKVGQPLKLTFIHPQGFVGEATTDFIAEQAQKRPLTYDTVLKQVDRLGNTPFEIGDLELMIEGEIMVPVSEINEARRKAIEALESLILKNNKPEPVDYNTYVTLKSNELAYKEKQLNSNKLKLSVTVGDVDGLKSAVEAGVDVVYLSGDILTRGKIWSKQDITWAQGFCRDKGVELIYQTPRIAIDADMIKVSGIIDSADFTGILCSNLGFLKKYLAEKVATVMADFSLNIFNRQTLLWLAERGVKRVTLSPELHFDQLKQIASNAQTEVECLVHGSLPMMVSEYCAPGSLLGGLSCTEKCRNSCKNGQYGLKDRLGMVFPIEVDSFCRMHIYNPKELCLIDEIGNLAAVGVNYLRIEGKREEPAQLGRIVGLYRKEIDRYLAYPTEFQGSQTLKDELNSLSPEGITKGHLYRGVM